jgi:hypothetical protein
MSKCDLDPGGRGLVVWHDTSSYYNKHLCQVISNSFDKWQSYGPSAKVWRTDGWTDGQSPFPYPPFSSKRLGTIKVLLHCTSSKWDLFLYKVSCSDSSCIFKVTIYWTRNCGQTDKRSGSIEISLIGTGKGNVNQRSINKMNMIVY